MATPRRARARDRAFAPDLTARWLAALLILSGLLVPRAATAPPVGAAAAVDALADVLPAEREAIATSATDQLDAYRLDVALDPTANTVGGTAEIRYRNRASEPLPEVFFRLYPNAAYYGDGDLTIDAATVDAVAVEPTLELDGSALRVPLPAPLAAGDEVDIVLAFTTTVPLDSEGSYGIFQRDTGDGTWVLADWHPVLAVYEEGDGWVLDPVTPFGDPTHAATALYDVTVAAPADLTLVASGVEVGADEPGRDSDLRSRRFIAGPAREFTMVADDDYEAVSTEAGGTTVTVYVEPDAPSLAAAEAAASVAARALAVYGERFGPYPFVQLDLVQTPLADALAVSWAGIIFLDSDALLGGYAADDPDGFATVVAHEVAHLWWGGTVGSNSNRHTFVNEGLATLSSLLYQEEVGGAAVAAAQRKAWVIRPARSLLARGDAVVDLPIAADQDPSERAQAAYGKGALGFLAIRAEIGDEAFAAALRAHAADHRFAIAAPDDLLAAFEAASGDQLDPLWERWFEQAAMTEAEIAALA